MSIDDFAGCQRITVDGVIYIVLSMPVPNVAECVRESDITFGAPYVTTVLVGMP